MAADISKFIANMAAIRRRQLAAAKRGVDRFGEQVLGDSQQLTPVDTGSLQASATTLPAEAAGTKIRKVLGHNTDYAAAVHERLDQRHKVGQAKFLETAMLENEPKFIAFVGNQIRSA